MTPQNLEYQLVRLAADWPMPSVTDAVMARVEQLRLEPAVRQPRRAPQWALLASAAAAVVAIATWLVTVATPRSLQAQVQQAIEEAESAHIVISNTDVEGKRSQAEIWYSQAFGFRAESPDEIIIDDGTQQLSWRPAAEPGEVIVRRRASRDAISMIAESFRFESIPAGWSQTRAEEFDREVHGARCQAYLVAPSTGNDVRLILLTDAQRRIALINEQRQSDGQWKSGREVSIEYGASLAAEKFVAKPPEGARVIDADGLLEKQFPLEKALATTEAGGMLFAVHDVNRVDAETFFVLSSVRGTPEYLKQNPPQRRHLNLQASILDVAQQPSTPGNGDGCNRATLATAESEGVHYLWWLAVRRRYFSVDEGVETVRSEMPSLEIEPGRVKLPLQAIPRTPGASWITAFVQVDLPAASLSLEQVAGRVRRDVLAIRQDVGAQAAMHGGVKTGVLEFLQPADVSNADYARAITEQLEWLHSLDEVQWPPQEIGLLPAE